MNTAMSKSKDLVLALDQGTHASRALVLDQNGCQVASAMRPVSLNRLDAHRVEQDGKEVLSTLSACIEAVLEEPAVIDGNLTAAGLATQRSSIIAWDRETGDALSPVLSWQDTRAAALLADSGLTDKKARALTGLPLSPHYGASKLRWLLTNNQAVNRAANSGRLMMGPLASFLVFHLTCEQRFVIDHGNAQRTQLMNIDTLRWDDQLLNAFGIEQHWLPVVTPIRHHTGTLRWQDIPLHAVNGDQNSAVYSEGGLADDEALVVFGSGAFILANSGEGREPLNVLLNTILDSSEHGVRYSIEGTVNGAGAALKWIETQWGPVAGLPDQWLENCDTPPVFINTVGGLGSPWWRTGIAPYFLLPAHDLGAEEKRAGVLESIVFLIQANLERLQQHKTITQLRVSGGLSQSDRLCQLLSNISGLNVLRPEKCEATARGIAWLATQPGEPWPLPASTFLPTTDHALMARYKQFDAELKTLTA
ncbi:MAG: glycerol kinase GlpK [Gammaproteobacteria bacterium]|nr:MAG: glycerol kinase GlpK [Gammaproteobacteria bacterium]